MGRKGRFYQWTWLKHDLPAGLTVFIIALPLCLGIAIASDAPLYAGLISGIVGGLLVTWISGSALSVSGPAAGLTTIVSAAILSLGSYPVFLVCVVIAGVFQCFIGLFKLGNMALFFPTPVINGMLASIGLVLIYKQLPYLIDVEGEVHLLPAMIAIGSLFILYVTKKGRRWKWIPPYLLVVISGILVHRITLLLFPEHALLPSQLVHIPNGILQEIQHPDFSMIFTELSIWSYGLMLGIVGSIETLLCIEAVDKMDKKRRKTPLNREMMAQGIGNITSGMLGGLPITAVVVRGVANLEAGARTKLSSATHGACLLISIMYLTPLLQQIPLACLSALLLATGYQLSRPELYIQTVKKGWRAWIPFITTIIIALSFDLLAGVIAGLLTTLACIDPRTYGAQILKTEIKPGKITLELRGNMTFIHTYQLEKKLWSSPTPTEVHIIGTHADNIDDDLLLVIYRFERLASKKQIKVTLTDIPPLAVYQDH
jgi:MFS superfamily sulfate permease-like transporter